MAALPGSIYGIPGVVAMREKKEWYHRGLTVADVARTSSMATVRPPLASGLTASSIITTGHLVLDIFSSISYGVRFSASPGGQQVQNSSYLFQDLLGEAVKNQDFCQDLVLESWEPSAPDR